MTGVDRDGGGGSPLDPQKPPKEPPGPGHGAAVLARNAIEEALLVVPDIALTMDRAGIGARLTRAIQCAYSVIDSHVLAPVHYEGLNEAATLVGEARALLSAAGDRSEMPPLGRCLDHLGVASSALRGGAEAVAQLQMARRTELRGGGIGGDEIPKGRPFRASIGMPRLHAFPRRPMVPHLSLDAKEEIAAAPPPPKSLAPPKTLDELTAFAKAASSGELEKKLAADEPESTEGEAAEPPPFAFEPAVEEAEVLRRIARDCLEDIAVGRDLRKPNAMESWLDQEPFEQRLLDNLDAFAALGGAALPMVTLYQAEAPAPDPGRAFATALVLGSIEGRDTTDVAVATLKQSQPETFPGWIEGFWLAPGPAIDTAMADLLTGPRLELRGLALDVLIARRMVPADTVRRLSERREPVVAVRVCQALGVTLPRDEAVALLENTMAIHEDDDVWLAAAESLLRRGHAPVRGALRVALTDAARPARADRAAVLLALGGHETDAEPLLAHLAARPTPVLLRALGRFGHVAALGALLRELGSGDDERVAAAAEALERITGAGMFEIVEEPWEVELPPEAAEAGGLPIPTRKVQKPIVDAARWEAWLRQNAGRLDDKTRWRGGRPFAPVAIVDELEAKPTPPARRPEAALELAIATSLVSAFAPDDWVARQKRHLAELREQVESLDYPAGTWSFGAARNVAPVAQPEAPKAAPVVARTMAFELPAGLIASLTGGAAMPFQPGAPGAQPPRPAPGPPLEDSSGEPETLPDAALGGTTAEMEPLGASADAPDRKRPSALPFRAPVGPPAVGAAPPVPQGTGAMPPFAAAPPTARAGVVAPPRPFVAPPPAVVAPPPVRLGVPPSPPPQLVTPPPAMAPAPAPSAPTAPVAPVPPSVTQPPSTAPGTDPMKTTSSFARSPALGPLPFTAGATRPTPVPTAQPKTGLPFTAPARPPAASAGPVPSLTMEQYAWACVQLSLRPDRADDLFARFGFADRAGWEQCDRGWQDQLNGDGVLRQQWVQLVDHYRKTSAR